MSDSGIKSFIKENLRDSVPKLMLKYGNDSELRFAVSQIAARQKIKDKLPGFYNNLNIILPESIPLEQSSSEITAAYKADITDFNTCCDLTGGLGIDSLYLARKAEKHTYIEQNKELADIFELNLHSLKINNIDVINSDSVETIKKWEKLPDLIYLDPARRSANGQKTYFLEDTLPNPIKLIEKIRDRFRHILLKTSPMLDISRAITQLPFIKEIHIVSVKNDCKELLFLLENNYDGAINYHTVNFTSNESCQKMVFSHNSGDLPISPPRKYLYEANSSINKLGFRNSLASSYKLTALEEHTNLFTSEIIMEDFPGRVFEILHITKINKKEIAVYIPNRKANISIKNLPISISGFKKKTGIKEGGELYLFAAKSETLGNICLICKKVGNF